MPMPLSEQSRLGHESERFKKTAERFARANRASRFPPLASSHRVMKYGHGFTKESWSG